VPVLPRDGVGGGAQSSVLSGCLGMGVLMWVERWHWGHRLWDRWRGTLLGPEGTSVHCCGGCFLWCGWRSSSPNGSWPVWLWVRGGV
jgi:hypothetical protein